MAIVALLVLGDIHLAKDELMVLFQLYVQLPELLAIQLSVELKAFNTLLALSCLG